MKDAAQLLVALFAGMWGSFGMLLKIVEMLNARRDVVLGMCSSHGNLTPINRRQLLFADWLPLWIGGLVFLLVAMVFFLAVPDIAVVPAQWASYKISLWRTLSLSPLQVVSYVCATLAFIGFNGLAWGGSADIRRMRAALRRSGDIVDVVCQKDRRQK